MSFTQGAAAALTTLSPSAARKDAVIQRYSRSGFPEECKGWGGKKNHFRGLPKFLLLNMTSASCFQIAKHKKDNVRRVKIRRICAIYSFLHPLPSKAQVPVVLSFCAANKGSQKIAHICHTGCDPAGLQVMMVVIGVWNKSTTALGNTAAPLVEKWQISEEFVEYLNFCRKIKTLL